MRAHVLLNLLNELGKKDQMRVFFSTSLIKRELRAFWGFFAPYEAKMYELNFTNLFLLVY